MCYVNVLIMVLCLLQVSNLKKIVQGIVDYYQECLNQHLTDFSRPDVVKIGNNVIYVLCLRAVISTVIVLCGGLEQGFHSPAYP